MESSDTPLLRILRSFSLQKYYSKLDELGYSYDLHSLALSTKEQLRNISERLNMLPSDFSIFHDMIDIIKFLIPENTKVHRRSISSDLSEDSKSHDRRKSFGGLNAIDEGKDYVKLTNIIEQYNDKIEQGRKEEEKQMNFKRELEEAKIKINELTQQLKKQAEIKTNNKQVGSEPLPIVDIRPKEVGVSYDSFKLRSTLAHLDIEEMCRCLSKAIRIHINHALEISRSREDISPLRLSQMPDFFEDTNQDNITKIDEGIKVPGAIIALFRQEFEDLQAAQQSPFEKDIYYFVKNIIFRSKMEKECSIISLIYIERMINKTGLYVNIKTWKKLTLISLIIASKVWDDESYENVHFAKVFTKYPLKEINSLERLFLSLIDYNVGVTKSEYAKYYFILRTYAEKNRRSFPLKPLAVDTVRKLQRNANHAEERFKNIHGDALFSTA